jgi:hypothetical protein
MLKIYITSVACLLLVTSLSETKKTTQINKSFIVKNNNNDTNINVIPDSNVVDSNFGFVYESFKYYNPNIDTATVSHFLKVCKFYNFDSNENTFRLCVGQILLESGAKQYKNGKVNIGSGGHIGIAQISPTSGLNIMVKVVTDEEFEDFKLILSDTNIVKPKNYSQSVKWLSDVNKNLMLWGYIVNRNLKTCKIENALVRYNAGPGGYLKYINAGNKISNHHYIRGIKTRLANID